MEVHTFGELMTMSGLVLTDDVRWVSFHSSYDFGYLVKTLTCQGKTIAFGYIFID